MKNRKIIFIISYLVLVAVCLILVYAIPSIRGMMVKTYVAEQGEITLSDEVDAYIVRDEKSYVTKTAGKIKRLAAPDKLYMSGTKIIDFHDASGVAKTDNCISKKPGYVVYSTDGGEGKLKYKKIEKIKLSQYEEYSSAGIKNCPKSRVSSGDAMFKIVKNRKWYLTFFVDKNQLEKYIEGNEVYIRVNDEDVKSTVYSVTKGKDLGRVILKCGIMFDGCLSERKISTEIVVANARGLQIQDDSIVKKDGKIGVIVKNKMGNYLFKPICIKADDGENSVVYQDIYMDEKSNFVETLKIYDEIIAHPTEKDIAESK